MSELLRSGKKSQKPSDAGFVHHYEDPKERRGKECLSRRFPLALGLARELRASSKSIIWRLKEKKRFQKQSGKKGGRGESEP